MIYKPNCEHPVLLVNRAALNYAKLTESNTTIHGPVKHIVRANDIKNITQGILLEYAKSNEDKLEDCYVQFASGYKEPLFIYAPCGHCTLCKENKRNDLVFRSIMESSCYTCPPVFFTLTYDDQHLPCLEVDTEVIDKVKSDGSITTKSVHYKYDNKCRGELRYKDVQDFFKRLRRRWDRKGLKHNIRYLVSGEYGSKYGRPHYHVIMWNNPYNADENNKKLFKQLEQDIFLSWGKCQPQGFDFGQCRGGASAYAAKYVSKPCKMHGHHTKPFIHCSNGHGGIGSPLLKKQTKHLRKNPMVRKVTFRDYSGQLQDINFSSYITSQVWPSPTRLVSPKLRNLYKQFCETLSVLQSLRVYSYSECRELAELANPCPIVIPNQYKSSKPIFPCRRSIQLYHKPRLIKLLNDITTELCEIYPIDLDYVNQYFVYKGLQPSNKPMDNASRILRIHNRLSALSDRELF